MRILAFFILTLCISFSAELTHTTIGNQDFSITTESYDIYDSKGTVMRMYKEERNNDLTFILSLTLDDKTGSCAGRSTEDGTYSIEDNKITLYSFWDRTGRTYDTPYGARIQVYEVQPDHSVVRISSRLYIETEHKKYNEDSAMKHLFTPPSTKEEKNALSFYIKAVEKNYKGTFVTGDEAKNLITEVKNALHKKMKSRWK